MMNKISPEKPETTGGGMMSTTQNSQDLQTKYKLLLLASKTKLASVLKTIDDSALKELNWKKIVGDFLVKGKSPNKP